MDFSTNCTQYQAPQDYEGAHMDVIIITTAQEGSLEIVMIAGIAPASKLPLFAEAKIIMLNLRPIKVLFLWLGKLQPQ